MKKLIMKLFGIDEVYYAVHAANKDNYNRETNTRRIILKALHYSKRGLSWQIRNLRKELIKSNEEREVLIDRQIARAYSAVGADGVSRSLDKLVSRVTEVWQSNVNLERRVDDLILKTKDLEYRELDLQNTILRSDIKKLIKYVKNIDELSDLQFDERDDLKATIKKYRGY